MIVRAGRFAGRAGGVATLALLALLPACEPLAPARVETPPDSAAGEVPFRLAGPNEAAILVAVRLNGRGPYDFVLDTGATLTCVDRGLADRLALPDRPGLPAFGVGAGGSGRVRFVQVDTMQVGAAKAFDLAACVLDLGDFQAAGLEAEGLLGLNFLKTYRMTLDFEREALLLQAPQAAPTR